MRGGVELVLGPTEGEHVVIKVWRRAHPGGLAVFDHNWLTTEVAVRTAMRSWRFHAFLRAGDFAKFGTRLQALAAQSRGSAKFEPIDPWVVAVVTRCADAVFEVGVRAREGGSEKAAWCAFELDCDGLEVLIGQVREVSRQFPVFSSCSSDQVR